MSSRGSGVTVFVRTRPTGNFAQDLIQYLPDGKTINIHMRKTGQKGLVNNQLSDWSFRLDGVLHDVSQENVYDIVAKRVVLGALDGYNGTVMCFGQTGAGKTHTMTGATESYKQRGIIPRALQEVFREIEERPDQANTVRLSFLEIYNETLLDLLSSLRDGPSESQMAVVEEGGSVYVKGLSVHLIHTEEEALNLLFEGEMNRMIASHALNKNSSRSHCILTVHIESRSRTLSDAKYITSKLNLVDLAGSERLSKTGSEGQVLKEALHINKSLSFLEQAIIALADSRRDHVPFRQSKLTHALKDSLGGNCNTVLVANIYGEAAHIEETLSTLRFASRMKCMQTVPVVNEHIDPVLQVKILEKEIQLLKQELAIHDILANRTSGLYDALTENQIAEIHGQVRKYLEGTVEEIDIVNIRQIQEVFAQFKVILQQQEQEVEVRLCQKFTLAERPQSTGSCAAAKRGILNQAEALRETVGEVDGRGFGVGVAPPSTKPVLPLSPRRPKPKRDSPIRMENAGSPGLCKEGEMNSLSRTNHFSVSLKELESREQEPQNLDSQCLHPADKERHSRPDSPPPRAEAFEEFKSERGSEINRILKENKEILLERKQWLRELTDSVNQAKKEIDEAKNALQERRETRQQQGEFLTSEGEPVIEEDELAALLRLQELKGLYRSQYKELCNTRAEVQYCQHLVEQCRIRLLSEFEVWYNESFVIPEEVQSVLRAGGPIRPGLIPISKATALDKDEQEQFSRLRHKLLAASPRAISFYNAHMKAQKRHFQMTEYTLEEFQSEKK
uniref:Kinesin-like protein n=1 Tax=Lepisosteus oculatus TaxID=7918 RepID=W5MVQ4_LEPOC